jgi:hypothetical protein
VSVRVGEEVQEMSRGEPVVRGDNRSGGFGELVDAQS